MIDIDSTNSSKEENNICFHRGSKGNTVLEISNLSGYRIANFNDAVNLIISLYNEGEFDAAFYVLPIAIRFAKKHPKQSSEEFRRALTKFYGVAGDVCAERGDDSKALQFYKNFQCLKMQLKSNISADAQSSKIIKLYQFRRISNYSKENLKNNEITLSSPKLMNDIFDSLIYRWLDSPSYGATARYKKHLEPYKKSFNYYRVACFCEDNSKKNQVAIQNNLMWSHYADEHKGFCVEYCIGKDDLRKDEFNELSASRFFRINYWNPDNDEPIDFGESYMKGSLTAELAFLTKHKDWSYENEVRLLQYNPQNGNERVQYKLSDSSRISAVYFGLLCPEKDIQQIMELLSGRNIKFYKMYIDYSKIYTLQYKPI